NGTGTPLFAGNIITSTQTIYIYNESGTTPNTCSNESSFTVSVYPAINFTLTENNISINGDTVTVTMANTAITYEYALDTGSFQLGNIFSGLTPGTHILYVQDENGCVIKSVMFEIEGPESIIIPLFFTPNGDGQNDIWQVTDPKNSIQSIVIFDRYGKLLKQLAVRSKMWDGFYNGNLMPSNDYWYLITLKSGEQRTGHFTLKR
ncbi:T9SS type B sorting domain-containing protein, partial [Bizionia sediminis]